jgi:hypothetical protein
MHIIVIPSECNLTQQDQEPLEGCLRSYSPVALSEVFQGPEVPMVPMVIIFPASSGYVYFKKKL